MDLYKKDNNNKKMIMMMMMMLNMRRSIRQENVIVNCLSTPHPPPKRYVLEVLLKIPKLWCLFFFFIYFSQLLSFFLFFLFWLFFIKFFSPLLWWLLLFIYWCFVTCFVDTLKHSCSTKAQLKIKKQDKNQGFERQNKTGTKNDRNDWWNEPF